MSNTYRTGKKLATTIYCNNEEQPCAWAPGDPELAGRIVRLLNWAEGTSKESDPQSERIASLEADKARLWSAINAVDALKVGQSFIGPMHGAGMADGLRWARATLSAHLDKTKASDRTTAVTDKTGR